MRGSIGRTLAATAGLLALSVGAAPAGARDVMVVYDASGSMWGQIDGTAKIEIAREVMAELVAGWPADINLGLVAYGHRHEGRCDDIETLVPAGPLAPAEFLRQVQSIKPLGRTPLSAAVQHAAEALRYGEAPATVVLISDGIENCQADPCALAAALEARGIDFTAHVIGFDVKSEEYAGLACIAENTGGVFLPAENASALQEALQQVQTVIEQEQSAAEPEPEPEPQPEPEPAVEVEVTVTAPATVLTGEAFEAAWTPTPHPQDYVTVVPAGAKEGEVERAIRAGDQGRGTLVAPADAGLYEVRYLAKDSRNTLGLATLEVLEPEIALTAPDRVSTGASFELSWSKTVNRNDILTIVPAGAKEGEILEHRRTGDGDLRTTLVAPAEPGLYEVRYVLNEGRRTLAVAEIEVATAEVVVTAPPRAGTGETIEVSWSRTVHRNDILTIVPLGAKEGEVLEHRRTGEGKTQTTLVAPAEPGLYEVRYVLNEGRVTLARAEIEVVAVEVVLTAPAEATIGQSIEIAWSRTVHPNDILTIVPLGAKEGEVLEHRRTGKGKTETTLVAPAAPGLYEVRYVLNEGRVTLARAEIEVVAAEVVVSGPAKLRVKDKLTVSWDRTINSNDIVTVVPAGAPETEVKDHIRTGRKSEGTLKTPAAPGLYEVRYLLNEGRVVLGRHTLEVLAADAPLDAGVALVVPASATPGAEIAVSWTGGGSGGDQRLALARADQADFAWIAAWPAAGLSSLQVTLPKEPGRYEIRYLDLTQKTVLGRATVEVR